MQCSQPFHDGKIGQCREKNTSNEYCNPRPQRSQVTEFGDA